MAIEGASRAACAARRGQGAASEGTRDETGRARVQRERGVNLLVPLNLDFLRVLGPGFTHSPPAGGTLHRHQSHGRRTQKWMVIGRDAAAIRGRKAHCSAAMPVWPCLLAAWPHAPPRPLRCTECPLTLHKATRPGGGVPSAAPLCCVASTLCGVVPATPGQPRQRRCQPLGPPLSRIACWRRARGGRLRCCRRRRRHRQAARTGRSPTPPAHRGQPPPPAACVRPSPTSAAATGGRLWPLLLPPRRHARGSWPRAGEEERRRGRRACCPGSAVA